VTGCREGAAGRLAAHAGRPFRAGRHTAERLTRRHGRPGPGSIETVSRGRGRARVERAPGRRRPASPGRGGRAGRTPVHPAASLAPLDGELITRREGRDDPRPGGGGRFPAPAVLQSREPAPEGWNRLHRRPALLTRTQRRWL